MATLQELRSLVNDSDLHEKVEAALIIVVQGILDGTPNADQQRYAAQVFSSTKSEGDKAVMSVLAANSTASKEQIIGATDAAILLNVAAIVDTLTVAYIAGAS